MLVVLLYIPSIDRSSGGVGAYIQLIAKELGKIVDLHVLTHPSDNQLKIEKAALHYMSREWYNTFQVKKEFLTVVAHVNPDVFHTNACWLPLSAMTLFWARRLGLPCVYSPHGMMEPWIVKRNYWTKKLPALLLYQRKAINKSTLIHATADSEMINLRKMDYNRPIAVVPNCVDVFSIPMKLSWKRKKQILFLSRIHVKKGIENLIEAVFELRERLTGYLVKIVGPGEEEYVSSLKCLVKERGLSDFFEFSSGVFGDDKWILYQNSDIFVLPTFSENFGIVVTEALSSGTPVITTKGTPWHELETNRCGWWVDLGVEPLKQALLSFLSMSESELEEMGHNGRRLVEERYSDKMVARQMKAVYEWVTGSGEKPEWVYE